MDQWADAVVPKDHFVRRFAWAGLGRWTVDRTNKRFERGKKSKERIHALRIHVNEWKYTKGLKGKIKERIHALHITRK